MAAMVSDGEKEGRWPPESAFGATARPNKVNFYPITLKLGHKPPVDVVWRRVWPAKPYGEFEGPLAKRSRMKHRNGGNGMLAGGAGRAATDDEPHVADLQEQGGDERVDHQFLI